MVRVPVNLTGVPDLQPIQAQASLNVSSDVLMGFVVNFRDSTYFLPNQNVLDQFIDASEQGDLNFSEFWFPRLALMRSILTPQCWYHQGKTYQSKRLLWSSADTST